MANDRPEKLGDGFVERVEGGRFSMLAFIELTRAVPEYIRRARPVNRLHGARPEA
jgi:hypothetical protein